MRLQTVGLALVAILLAVPAQAQTCAAEINAVSAEVAEARHLSATDLLSVSELFQTAKAQCVAGDEPGALATVAQIRQLLIS
jgi:hypothetical protein